MKSAILQLCETVGEEGIKVVEMIVDILGDRRTIMIMEFYHGL